MTTPNLNLLFVEGVLLLVKSLQRTLDALSDSIKYLYSELASTRESNYRSIFVEKKNCIIIGKIHRNNRPKCRLL